jgi:betaine-aldehyde dehydrogenase
VHFTGGSEIGAEIMKVCADRMARVTLELGGKSAAIIASDANLEDVVPVLAGGLTMMSGQMCIAMSRILVARPLHDELVERLVTFFSDVRIGDPLDPETVWGPLASKRARERAEGYIRRAVDEGAQVACGGTRPAEFPDGNFLTPTVLTNVNNDMEVAQQEVFGPVFSVIPFDSIEEAVHLANASKYGLAGSIFTQDEGLALDVARRIRTGAFCINATFPCLTAPFGGMKQSGFGREGGIEGLLELTNIKSIALSLN